jgi:hypothetical protein
MTDEQLLLEIKTRLSITGTHHDSLLLAYANDVKDYMLSAGVDNEIVQSKKSLGAIARGVADLWTGEGTFSELFKQRVIQLTFEVAENV